MPLIPACGRTVFFNGGVLTTRLTTNAGHIPKSIKAAQTEFEGKRHKSGCVKLGSWTQLNGRRDEQDQKSIAWNSQRTNNNKKLNFICKNYVKCVVIVYRFPRNRAIVIDLGNVCRPFIQRLQLISYNRKHMAHNVIFNASPSQKTLTLEQCILLFMISSQSRFCIIHSIT